MTTGAFWDDLVKYININFFDELEAFKTLLLLNVLIPFKRFLLSLPWIAVVVAPGASPATRSARWRLAPVVALVSSSPHVGLWDKAMITIYLCGISVLDRLPDRHADRDLGGPATTGCGGWSRQSSTRCRPCRPSSI